MIIGASSFIIKSNHLTPLPLAASPISIILVAPTVAVGYPDSGDDYIKTYARCGEIPLLPEYFSPDNSSPKLWSPDCRFISWSVGSDHFVYNLNTQKISHLPL